MNQHFSAGPGAAPLALAFLGLVTLADSITTSTFSALSDPSLSQPGFWNLGTTATILSGVSDLVGQLVLGYVADSWSRHYAMAVNASSIFVASIFTVLTLLLPTKWPILAAIVAPLLKCFGGGSHGSAFLSLAVLHPQSPISSRSAYYYATGAVIVVARSCGQALVSLLARHGSFLPGVVSGLCCLVAYGAAALFSRAIAAVEPPGEHTGASITDPLLPRETAPQQESYQETAHPGPFASYHEAFSSLHRNVRDVALALFLMAISKATRPLFTTYIQHRDGATPKQAQTLWCVRSTLSFVIFGLLLPLAVIYLPPKVSSSSNSTLHLGRMSIILMGFGALMIGLSTSFSAITRALIVNTLGVAADLSALAFSANFFSSALAGRVFMLISSLESAGTLLGIGTLYPIHQWSLEKVTSFAGGTPYYVCASIYAVATGLFWSLTPISPERWA